MPNTLLRTRIRKERKALTAKQRANFAFMASLHLPKLLPHLPKMPKLGHIWTILANCPPH